MNLKTQFSRAADDPELIGPAAPPTPRSARRKMMLLALGGLLALTGVGAAFYYFSMRPVTLRIAVGPGNSDDAKVIQALTQAFLRDHNHVRLRPLWTDGATASAAALASGKVDLAVIRGDLEVPQNALAVATLRKNVAVLWVPTPARSALATQGNPVQGNPTQGKKAARDGKEAAIAKETPITKIPQLAGHRVGVIGRTQANVNLLKVILQQYGVDPARVEIVQFSTSEVSEAVRGQKVDAFMAAGPVNSRITADAIAATSRDGAVPTFLSIDLADAIAANNPKYETSEIPAGAFGGTPDRPDDEVKTIGFGHHIAARRGLSDVTVSAFTRQLFAARQLLIGEFPLAAKIATPDTDKDAAIPAHPGAAAYVDGEEKTFLDRYSDYIWFTLIGLSAIGSIGAWLASYLRKDERMNNSTMRERLLDMLAIARHSGSIEELDAMQSEADLILRETLARFEQGAIGDGALTAFNIALEQFHNAVADRKTLLVATPASPPARTQRPQVA